MPIQNHLTKDDLDKKVQTHWTLVNNMYTGWMYLSLKGTLKKISARQDTNVYIVRATFTTLFNEGIYLLRDVIGWSSPAPPLPSPPPHCKS